MQIISRLQISRHGIYYLRIQRNGSDRRYSLKTRDKNLAELAALQLSVTIQQMKIDPNKIKGWTLKSDGQSIEIQTEDNDADRASALDALVAYAEAQAGITRQRTDAPKPTISIAKAIEEYRPHLAKSNVAEKSQRMALSTLAGLEKQLGSDFDVSKLNDEVVEEKWLAHKLTLVAETTAKRDLSFIRSFVSWATDKKRKYTPAPLTLAIKAKGDNWSYLAAADLKLIFDNLPKHAEKPWHLWLPLISLYTGARIGEISSQKTEHIFEKSGINAMRLAGTKTEASDRTIPIHPDLLRLGFLEYVSTRREHEMLFEIPENAHNGVGGMASKWYTGFKNDIGLKDKLKVFHSFRPTIVDHLKQAGAPFEARCQYVGHDSGGGVHNKVYGRNELNLGVIKAEVVGRIDWLKYCGWEPNIAELKKRAQELQ